MAFGRSTRTARTQFALQAKSRSVMNQPLIVDEAAKELCAHDRMQLFAHGETLRSLTSRTGLADCLDSLRAWLGLTEIVVGAGMTQALADARVVGSGCDAEWMNLYSHEQFALVDPIVRAIVNGQRYLDRSEAIAGQDAIVKRGSNRGSNAPMLARFLDAARDHGRLGHGFASGIVFNGHMALCSVITSPGRSNRVAPRALCALRPLLYQALMRIFLPEPVFPGLSQREHVTLECLASGHSDTQIADALSISESTVRFHLGNVFDKLGARNRCHAVAIGFQSGLLQR